MSYKKKNCCVKIKYFNIKSKKSFQNKIKDILIEDFIIQPCNRCCSKNVENKDISVICNYCGHTEPFEEWQIIGWRDITKYPPHFGGSIHVYGENIGRTMAKWDSKNKTCDNKGVTHWLRVPDPTKQINMK
jgi:hypothetical protein